MDTHADGCCGLKQVPPNVPAEALNLNVTAFGDRVFGGAVMLKEVMRVGP